MRLFSMLAILCLCLSGSGLAQEVKVTPLSLPAGSPAGEITGDIANGVQIPMKWAESSSVALVPATRFVEFNGKQVFYSIQMPASSVIKIKMTPEQGKKINLYALRQSAQKAPQVPPNVTSAISSEASYPIYANVGGGRQVRNKDKGYREVEFMSVNRPYNILIGVSGAEGEMSGTFTLNIEIKGR